MLTKKYRIDNFKIICIFVLFLILGYFSLKISAKKNCQVVSNRSPKRITFQMLTKIRVKFLKINKNKTDSSSVG